MQIARVLGDVVVTRKDGKSHTLLLGDDVPSIDIDSALKQAMILHRRAVTLHKELMAAERALAEDGSETSLAIIRDLQLQLSALDGMEAERDRLGGAGVI